MSRNEILAALIREANPMESFPIDDDECVAACDHNVFQWCTLADCAAEGDVAAMAELRSAFGLPVLS